MMIWIENLYPCPSYSPHSIQFRTTNENYCTKIHFYLRKFHLRKIIFLMLNDTKGLWRERICMFGSIVWRIYRNRIESPMLKLGWSMNISCIYCMTRRLISSHAWDGGSPVGITLSITSVISFANLTIYTGMFGIFVWLALRIEMQ